MHDHPADHLGPDRRRRAGDDVWMSPLLALIALLTVPLSLWSTRADRPALPEAVRRPVAWTGPLNGHVEQMYTGHRGARCSGTGPPAESSSTSSTSEMYAASFRRPVHLGRHPPAMMFISNLNYVLVSVVGGLQVASGTITLGDVQAFIQYARQFQMPMTQIAAMVNLMQSGVASAERVFEFLDAEERVPRSGRAAAPGRARAGWCSTTSPSGTCPTRRSSTAWSSSSSRGDLRDRRPDRRRQDHPGQPAHAVLRRGLRADHRWTASTPRR